jgi:hypothetical protein
MKLSIGRIEARNLAIGPNAVVNEHRLPLDHDKLAGALAELRRGLSGARLDPDSRAACEACVRSLETEARKPQPDPARLETFLGRMASHLMAGGVVLRETLALRQPIETIAGLVGTSLSLLRLW